MANNATSNNSCFNILLLIVKYWKTFLIVGIVSAVVSFTLSTPFFIKPKYKSSVIMFSTSSNAVSQLILAEGNYNEFLDVTQFGDDAHIEQMIQILNSREIKDHIIEKFNLIEHYDIDTTKEYWKTKLYKYVKNNIQFSRTDNLAVEITVEDTDPVLASDMELLSEIFGQFVSVGVIALIVVFQPEIRKFLLFIGSKNPLKKANITIWKERVKEAEYPQINTIVKACVKMSSTLTGALIIITKENNLEEYIQTGELINAKTSRELIETIFFKNTPLHDGALIITNKTMVAARCILPVSRRSNIPTNLGLRHRAALGITENTDCVALIVSEQTGSISYCIDGNIKKNVSPEELKQFLEKQFYTSEVNNK
jgi:diadenylate cyclase